MSTSRANHPGNLSSTSPVPPVLLPLQPSRICPQSHHVSNRPDSTGQSVTSRASVSKKQSVNSLVRQFENNFTSKHPFHPQHPTEDNDDDDNMGVLVPYPNSEDDDDEDTDDVLIKSSDDEDITSSQSVSHTLTA